MLNYRKPPMIRKNNSMSSSPSSSSRPRKLRRKIKYPTATPALPNHLIPPRSPRAYLGISNLKHALSDEAQMELAFSEWKKDNKRFYPTIEEERRRFELFKSSVADMVYYDSDCETVGLSEFADWTTKERKRLCGALKKKRPRLSSNVEEEEEVGQGDVLTLSSPCVELSLYVPPRIEAEN